MKWMYLCGIQLLVLCRLCAQNPTLIYAGKIEYEKKMNVHAIVDDLLKKDPVTSGELDGIKDSQPQFFTQLFTLSFSKEATLYRQMERIGDVPMMLLKNLVIYSDLQAKTRITERDVRGKKFLVGDSIRKVQWRITNETRTIEGFECKRANGLIFDTVYVVAFFTAEIVPAGGPDAFNGLPGMILQVNLPNEHISWTARKISLQVDPVADLTAPSGSKTLTDAEYYNVIDQLSGRNFTLKQFVIKQLTL